MKLDASIHLPDLSGKCQAVLGRVDPNSQNRYKGEYFGKYSVGRHILLVFNTLSKLHSFLTRF